MLVLCCYLGQEHRGPYATIWSRKRYGEDDHDLQDGSYLDYLSFEATFVFLTFLYYVVIFVKNIGVLILLSGVVEDRRG